MQHKKHKRQMKGDLTYTKEGKTGFFRTIKSVSWSTLRDTGSKKVSDNWVMLLPSGGFEH